MSITAGQRITANMLNSFAAQADATTFSETNPTALVDVTNSWSIPALDAAVSTTYIIETMFYGLWEASGALNFGFDLDGTKTSVVPVSASIATAAHNYGGVARLYLQVLTTGSGGTCNIWFDGTVSDVSVNRIGSTGAGINGVSLAHAIDTTASHTLAVCVDFAVSNASQTYIGYGSTFTRKGPWN